MVNMKIKNVYNGEQLRHALLEAVEYKEVVKIIFHEDEYGFPEDQIEVNVSYSEGRYHVETAEFGLKHFVSARTFKDYVFAVCGWGW